MYTEVQVIFRSVLGIEKKFAIDLKLIENEGYWYEIYVHPDYGAFREFVGVSTNFTETVADCTIAACYHIIEYLDPT